MRALHRFSYAIVAALIVTAASAQGQDQIPWQPNLETAQQLAGQTNRLVLVHFWAPWCQPCLRLDKEVFAHAETAQALNPSFVFVKLNVDEAPGTARLYGVSSLPTDVILSSTGRLVSQMQSPPTAAQYIAQMNQAAAGHRDLARKSQAQVGGPSARTPDAVYPAGATVPPAGAANPQVDPTQTPNSNDRYAEYSRERPQAQQFNTQAAPSPQYAPTSMSNPPGAPVAQGAPAGASVANQQPYTARASYQPPPQQGPQLPPGCPPLGLDGYCPVTLSDRQQWTLGDVRWGAVHRGRTYLFVGSEEQKKFLADPDLYAPVLSGNDPVIALDQRAVVPGRREFGISYERRVYLFADESTRQRFEQNPKRYANEVLQAMR